MGLLTQWIGVGGCGWPSSYRVSLNIMPPLMLKNNAPNSTSAADASTKGKMVKSVWNALLGRIVVLFWGRDPRKNITPPLLCAILAENYDELEWIYKKIRFVDSHLGVRMGCKVVKKLAGIVGNRFSGFWLMARDSGKEHAGCHVNCAALVQDAANFILYHLLQIIGGVGIHVFWVWFLCCSAIFAAGGGGWG